MNPFDLWNLVKAVKAGTERRFDGESKTHKIMRFLFANYFGMLIPGSVIAFILYWLAPVTVHKWIFKFLILEAPSWIAGAATLLLALRFTKRYVDPSKGLRGIFNPIAVTSVMASIVISVLVVTFAQGAKWVQINNDAQFEEIQTLPRVSNELVRYTPAQVAAEEIVRRTQSSEFSPGDTRPIGSTTGVAYIAPLQPQGMWNALFSKNNGFMYFEDGGTNESLERVTSVDSDPFEWGEGMEVFDAIHRRLIHDVGFFNTYPEIYYAPVYDDQGEVIEVIGVAPYISYRFWWGIMVPKWGGVAIFHADGTLEELTPEEAAVDPRLITTQSTFPKQMAHDYVHSERYDQGGNILARMWYGFIRRPGKIEIPPMPGKEQQPFFLPMEDGSYSYLTTVEPDGDAYSLMRVYMVDARTGKRTVYRLDTEDRPRNLQGPRKVISYVKALPNYVWLEGSGKNASGTYRIVEPRPVTPDGQDTLYWMLSITPADYARVVATVFVDSTTNEVHGPFETREEAFAWLQGEEVNVEDALETGDVLITVEGMCIELKELWQDQCGALIPGGAAP